MVARSQAREMPGLGRAENWVPLLPQPAPRMRKLENQTPISFSGSDFESLYTLGEEGTGLDDDR